MMGQPVLLLRNRDAASGVAVGDELRRPAWDVPIRLIVKEDRYVMVMNPRIPGDLNEMVPAVIQVGPQAGNRSWIPQT
jgi:hypothetical protein